MKTINEKQEDIVTFKHASRVMSLINKIYNNQKFTNNYVSKQIHDAVKLTPENEQYLYNKYFN